MFLDIRNYIERMTSFRVFSDIPKFPDPRQSVLFRSNIRNSGAGFDIRDVEGAVAKALKTQDVPDLSARRPIPDLSRGPDNRTRLITTNFDQALRGSEFIAAVVLALGFARSGGSGDPGRNRPPSRASIERLRAGGRAWVRAVHCRVRPRLCIQRMGAELRDVSPHLRKPFSGRSIAMPRRTGRQPTTAHPP